MSFKERDDRTGARDFSKFLYEVFQLSSVCGGVSVGGWVCTWVCVSEDFSNTTSSESMILRA